MLSLLISSPHASQHIAEKVTPASTKSCVGGMAEGAWASGGLSRRPAMWPGEKPIPLLAWSIEPIPSKASH